MKFTGVSSRFDLDMNFSACPATSLSFRNIQGHQAWFSIRPPSLFRLFQRSKYRDVLQWHYGQPLLSSQLAADVCLEDLVKEAVEIHLNK